MKFVKFHLKKLNNMKYIKLFSTKADYDSVKNSLDTPNVCLIEDTGEVIYGADPSKIVIMTSETNPEVLAICYAQGWCASESKMTLAEASLVTSIGTAFQGSNIGDFTEFQYFTSVKEIVGDAFKDSTVTKLYMPDSVIVLGTVRNVTSLTELRLSENLTSIPSYFGIPCPLYIPKSLQTIGYGFTRNISYPEITISPENTALEIIEGIVYTTGSTPTIQAQSYITSTLSIKSGVTIIPGQFCEDNKVVTTATIPSSVTTIGNRFFRNAAYLTTLVCEATTPPTIDTTLAFQGTSLVAIKVPSASVDTYKAASGWSTWADKIVAI